MLTFFIGSYTEYPMPGFGGIGKGIYTVQLNPETGELKVLYTENARNPSYLTLSSNRKYLYCVTELDQNENPKVRAYKIKDNYSLEFLNEQSVSGGYPCHIVEYQNNILVACYSTGNVFQLTLDVSGKILKIRKEYCHVGSSSHTTRQSSPHPHQISIHPNSNDVYVCDLGTDTIKAYRLDVGNLVPNEKNDCVVSKGGGPRHLVFSKNGNLAYVINELTGNVSVLQHDKGKLQELNTYRSLPVDYNGEPSGSAIRIHPKGELLYVANRKLEAISIFGIQGSLLSIIDFQFTNGNELREINISPDGKWLIACHQNSHDVVVYKILENGNLEERYRSKDILSPVCVVF